MTLFVVATPIGNLEDITLRALRVLAEVPLIAAEDTRMARRLLSHFNIAAPNITSYNDHNKRGKLPVILDALVRHCRYPMRTPSMETEPPSNPSTGYVTGSSRLPWAST